jgi:hypothetical protein
MKALVSLIAVLLLVLIAYAGVAAANLRFLFGVIVPYAAFLMFLNGEVRRSRFAFRRPPGSRSHFPGSNTANWKIHPGCWA